MESRNQHGGGLLHPVAWHDVLYAFARRPKFRVELAAVTVQVMEFNFDNDIFEASRERTQSLPSHYEAKICKDKWFASAVARDAEEELLIAKHMADNKYYNKEYKEALDYYIKCLAHIPASNTAAQRDCIEGKCRCYLKLGQYDAALELSKELDQLCLNNDHRVIVWRLLSEIHNFRNKKEDEQAALCKCICFHPETSEFWYRLSLCYLSQAKASGCRTISNLSVILTAAACLTKTSLLYQGSMSGQRSFARVENLRKQEKISKLLQEISAAAEFRELAKKEMTADADTSEEVRSEDCADIIKANTPPAEVVALFEKKWFAWIEKYEKQPLK
ncbi:uncharacterized protein C8orf76 homolog isoform X2 [Ornithodoros turicata]|uniref:uncharacterized protein C8orf76 homolog isoform X2 n=1 Tax=Ornithodoros turicata TaxID=34597 RepID=UPI00313A1AB9